MTPLLKGYKRTERSSFVDRVVYPQWSAMALSKTHFDSLLRRAARARRFHFLSADLMVRCLSSALVFNFFFSFSDKVENGR